MNEIMLTEDIKEEFRLMIYDIIREFVKQSDAELQIDMRNDDTIYLHSKNKIAIDLKVSYIRIEKIVQRTQLNGSPNKPDFEYVPTRMIQAIRLDDIVSVSYFNKLEEVEK